MTEVSLYDGLFGLVEKRLGRLKRRLDPGLYKVEFRVGSLTTTRYVAITGDQPEVKIALGPNELRVPAAAPLQEPTPSLKSAVWLSHTSPRPDGGRGAQILVFIQDPEGSEADGRRLAQGLTLHDEGGRLIADLGDRPESGPGWAGVLYEMEPGNYRLRAPGESGRIFEQSLAACRGWQTQVFLVHAGSDDVPREACLFDASIYLAPRSRGFDPTRPALRWVEQARWGLADGRDVLARALPNENRPELHGASRWLKFIGEEPMLGLLCIHLLRRRLDAGCDENQVGAIRRVIGEAARVLRGEVGDLPDLRAIEAWLDPERAPPASCADPPMLWESWKAAAEASRCAADPTGRPRAEVIRPDDLSARITYQVRGPGPWLVWEYSDDLDSAPSRRTAPAGDPAELVGRATAVVAKRLPPDRSGPQQVVETARDLALDRPQAELLGYFWNLGRSHFDCRLLATVSAAPPATEAQVDMATVKLTDVASDLVAPLSVVRDALGQLMARIAPDKPVTSRLLQGPWPPSDARAFVQSETFGKLLLELVDLVGSRYTKMNFADAVAHVFVWIDGKLDRDPKFLSSERFRSATAFLAYLRQAVWNAARLTEREQERYERRLEPLDLDRQVPDGDDTPEQAAVLAERLASLPGQQGSVLTRLIRDVDVTTESLASEMNVSVEQINRWFEEAVDALGKQQSSKRRGHTRS
jgi:hypothetical protein